MWAFDRPEVWRAKPAQVVHAQLVAPTSAKKAQFSETFRPWAPDLATATFTLPDVENAAVPLEQNP